MCFRNCLILFLASLATVTSSRLFSEDLNSLASRQLLQTTTGSVYAACPDNCDVDNGKCTFDSTNAGFKCTKCVNNLVVVKGRCACPAGRYLDVANSRCLDCPLGAWCPGGIYDQAQPRPADNINQPIRTNCTNGLITKTKRSKSRTLCINPPGSYYTATNGTFGGKTCSSDAPCAIACPADTYSPGLLKQKACTPCPSGFKTESATGAVSAQTCKVPPGYYLKTIGQVAACPRGEYQPNWVSSSAGVGTCTPCGTGITTDVPSAATARTNCIYTQAGYAPYSADDDSSPTYITLAINCPQNFYCPGGRVTAVMDVLNPEDGMQIKPCAVGNITGLWTQNVGATSVDECMIPPGYGKINSNSTEITQCSYGSVGQYRTGWLTGNQVNTDLAVCQTCGTNFKGVTNDELIVYTYNNSTGDYESSIANVAASTGNCYVDAGMGVYYIAGSDNSASSYRAIPCTKGASVYGVASITYGLVPNPCKPCSTGLEITDTSATSYLDPNSGGITNVAACVTKPGWGWDGRLASECPKGSWSAGGDLSPCTECGFGLTTNRTGSSHFANCTLAEGYGSVNGVIQLCPLGTYNDQDGVLPTSSACPVCPNGKTSTEVGAIHPTTDCDACPAGTGAPGNTSSDFTNGNCTTCSSGYYAVDRQSVSDQPDQSCQACPTSTTGFTFYYNATAFPYQSPAVSKAGATAIGDCLSKFAQITDALWFFADGQAIAGNPNSGDASIQACAALCTGDCHFLTYDYSATSGKCTLYTADPGDGQAILAYKAVPSGDIYSSTQSVVSAKTATPSGLYTQWPVDSAMSPLPGVGPRGVGDSSSKETCFNSCDVDTDCAAVFFQESVVCTLLRGVSSAGVADSAKRSLTRAVPTQAY